MKIILSLFFICCQTIVLSQTVSGQGTASKALQKDGGISILSGTQSIATSYTSSACGLNYLQVSQPLFGRLGNNFTLSVPQPATFVVTGLPACAVIEKAFLYIGTEGNGVSINVSVTNPGNGNSIFPTTIVGQGPDKGWGFPSSYTYRSDLTATIGGNGNYIISGIPTSDLTTANDATGATLLIIYSDRTQNYTGNIVVADGNMANFISGGATATLTGFNVCGTPSLTSSFMIVDDQQQYGASSILLNSATSNFTLPASAELPWDFISGSGAAATSGQSSAIYGITNTKDTIALLVAGMYYQTACLSCPSSLTLAASSTPSCLASGTVNVSGGLPPYTYTWTSSAQSTSVITDLSAGSQTVTVNDQQGCLTGSATLTVSTPAPTISVSSASMCIGYSASLTAGAAASYTWNPAASLNNPNAQTVTALPLVTTIYTVNYANALGCTGTQTTQATVTLTQNIAIANETLCAGGSVSLSTNSFTGSGYVWTGPGGYTATVQNPVITGATTLISGPYNLSVTSTPGCTSTAVSNVTVFPLPVPSISSNAPICSGFNLTLGGNGGNSYSWQGPNGFVSFATNTTVVNTTTLAAGVYTLTAFFTTGCSDVTTQSLTVWALPPATCAIAGTNVCIGATINFTSSGGGTYFWSGPNSFTSALQNPNIFNISLATNGVYTVTATDGNGCQASSTATLAAILNPTVSALNTTVCYGSPATMTAVGAGFFAWYGPNNYFDKPPIPFTDIPVADSLSAGVYTVVLVSLSSCSAIATCSLLTIPVPIPSATGTNVCLNAPATLTAAGGVGYQWTGPNNYTGLGANPVVPLMDSASTGFYTVGCTAANGCTATTTASLGTVPLPTVVATPTLICLNEPFTFSVTGANTYTWSGPSSYTAIGPHAYVPVANGQSTGTYMVVGTAINTCTQVTTATLQTMPLPIVITTGDTVCLNAPAILVARGGVEGGYTWKGPQGYTALLDTAVVNSATSAVVTTYSVVGTAPNTCTNSNTAMLVTRPLPPVTATGTIACFKYPFTLTAGGAFTYTWTGPPAHSYSVGQNFPIPVVDSAAVGIYTVVGTGAAPNTCTQVTTVYLGIMPLPTITAVSETVCFLQPALLMASGGLADGSGYYWTGPNGAFYSNLQNAAVPSATNVAMQTYTVTGTAPNTCTNYATATLSTFKLPQPYFTAPTEACLNTSVTVEGFGAQSYTWTGPYGQVYPMQNVVFPIYNVAQGGQYFLNVVDSNGCRNYTTTTIVINPAPEGQLISDNANMNCIPFCSTFSFQSKDPVPILSTSWNVGDVPINAETFRLCTSVAGSTLLTGYFTDTKGCSSTLTFAVNAYPTPSANFGFYPENPVENLNVVNFINTSMGQSLDRWNWFFVNNTGFESTLKNPNYIFDTSGTYNVAMIVQNAWGCQDTVIKTITVAGDFKIYIPNIFTPNGDGLNDLFQPKGRGITQYTLSVYDRWGIQLFQTTDFMQGWNGFYKGEMCDDNVYIWKIRVLAKNGEYEDLSGTVVLAR